MPGSQTPNTLKRLIASSLIYMVLAVIAGTIAVSHNFSAQPLGEGSGTGRPVLQEFLFGNGTAMSPGLPWLAMQAVLTLVASRKGRWSVVGVIGLAIFGLLSGVFATTEPMALQIFTPGTFEPLLALIEAGVILTPFAMLAFAILEWIRRRKGA